MSHIFISYSHKDTDYAHALAESLQNQGLEFWMDERLDYGSQWPLEIQKQLDSCDAFSLSMSPRSFESEWVQSELQRAKRKRKPIFPLLLEGDEPWLSIESIQYYDVRDEALPDERFYSAIKRVISTSNSTQMMPNIPNHAAKTKIAKQKSKLKTEVVVAIIGGVATIFAACATIFGAPLVSRWLASENGTLPAVQDEMNLADAPGTGVAIQTTSTVPLQPPKITNQVTAKNAFGVVPILRDLAKEKYDSVILAKPYSLTYTISLIPSSQVIWGEAWCATTKDILDNNFRSFRYKFVLDGQDISSQPQASIDWQTDNQECRIFYFMLYDWPIGQHNLTLTVTYIDNINDGFADFASGDYVSNYNVNVNP